MGNEIKTLSAAQGGISPLMGRIERMVAEMCPEGVKYENLSSICSIKGRIGFRGYTREDQVQEGYGALSLSPSNIQNGQMDYEKGTYITWQKYEESPEIMTHNGDIIFCKTASVGKVALVKNLPCKATINPQLVVLKDIKCNASYLTHCLGTNSIQRKVAQLAGVGSVPNLSQKALGELEIPLPPLPIQEAIADILDKFDRLSAELQAELQARKQQYEYYRNQLLTRFAPDQPVTEYSLGDLGTFTRGTGLQKSDFVDEGFPCIHYGQIYTRFKTFTDKTLTFVEEELAQKLLHADSGDLIIATTSENVEDVCKSVAWLGEGQIVTGGHACVYHHNQNPKYMAYFFQTDYFHNQKKKYAYGAKVIDIKVDNIAKITIPLPSLEEQARIVSILDKFEALVNDLSQGLPAEIAAVKEQYEYYRNKLLTFDKMS